MFARLPYIMFGVAVLILAVVVGYNNVRLQQQIDETSERSACITAQRNEEAQADLNNSIKYNRYVLALGGVGDIAIAQHEIGLSTDELERVKAAGENIEARCEAASG